MKFLDRLNSRLSKLLAVSLFFTATAAAVAESADEVCKRAEVLCTHNHFWQAVPLFDQAIELDGKCARAYHGRGNCYNLLGKHDKAIADWTKWIEIEPQDARAYQNRGTAYRALNQLPQAIKDYDQAIHLDPRYVKAHYNRGTCYEQLGDAHKALQDYEEALANASSNPTMKREIEVRIERVKSHSAKGAD